MGSQLCTATETEVRDVLTDAASLRAMKEKSSSTSAGTWRALLRKYPGCSLGMDVDLFEGTALVVYVVCKTGLVADWNRENPSKAIQKGDRILEVNGTKGDAWALAHACIDDQELKIVVQRVSHCTLKL
ncbi:Tmtc4 [Symbiodinium sp. CCMP2592]|nr:Tmtc4 [Symbiodinium sp. CCMP2592]